MAKKYTFIDDGFNPELVEQALFSGSMEIPVINPPDNMLIPKFLTPFSKLDYEESYDAAVCEYEHDVRFSDLIFSTKHETEKIKKYSAFITPDCSLYRDMPLCLQIVNTYFNRAIGAYFQSLGQYVITNIRWGDERSYTTSELPEKFAFLGAPKRSILSIGTYGCIKSSEDKYYFKSGLDAMLQELEPKIVLVYGAMPESIFADYEKSTQFVQYDDWTTRKKKGRSVNGNE